MLINFFFFLNTKEALSNYTISTEIARNNFINAQKINYLTEKLENSPKQFISRDLDVLIAQFNNNLTLLENGGTAELANQSVNVQEPDINAKMIISKMKKLWKPYQKNLALGMNEPKSIVVLDTIFYENDEIVYQEIALYKVALKAFMSGRTLEQLVRRHNARILEIESEYVVIEKTGQQHETEALLKELQPIGIYEFVRSGRVAIVKPMERLNKYLKSLEEAAALEN